MQKGCVSVHQGYQMETAEPCIYVHCNLRSCYQCDHFAKHELVLNGHLVVFATAVGHLLLLLCMTITIAVATRFSLH